MRISVRASLGMTRAQWVVLVRIEPKEGLKQAELADTLDLQPITLTRLCGPPGPGQRADRAALGPQGSARQTAVSHPPRGHCHCSRGWHVLGETLMADVLDGIDDVDVYRPDARSCSTQCGKPPARHLGSRTRRP